MHGQLADWIALNLLPGLGPILTRRALARFGDPGEVAYRVPAHVLASVGVSAKAVPAIIEGRRSLGRRAEAELRRAEKLGLRLAVPGAPDYPAAFETLPDAPVILFYKGELRQAVVRVAVVGSRRATAYGKRVAIGLGGGLAARGIEVVSGGARGIDTCAHVGALEEGGRTVSIMGSGFNHPYPPENRELFERIAGSGAVVSEFALDQTPLPENFPRRNRLISGLSAALVVVEAGPRSGSLITAGQALEQGREVLAVPGLVSSEQSEGCHRLIQQGAKLVQKIDDILEELSPMYRGALAPAARAEDPAAAADRLEGATPDEVALLALLDEVEPTHVEALAERAPFGIARLQTALFGLELRGLVERQLGPQYVRQARRR